MVAKAVANKAKCENLISAVKKVRTMKKNKLNDDDDDIEMLDNSEMSNTSETSIDKIIEEATEIIDDDKSSTKQLQQTLQMVMTKISGKKADNFKRFLKEKITYDEDEEPMTPSEMSKGQLIRIIQRKLSILEDKKEAEDSGSEDFTNSGNPNAFKLPNINIKQTMDNVMRGMKSEDFKAMKQDAKDLLETQKQLMTTVQEYAPLVQQGQEMLTTFKDYFGGDKNKKGSKLAINGASP